MYWNVDLSYDCEITFELSSHRSFRSKLTEYKVINTTAQVVAGLICSVPVILVVVGIVQTIARCIYYQ